jgi:hypothetical protein|tara:strand:- start:625 stop:1017 length:393 start_codon:yes stop_codon:yes gene_type:complete
MPKKTTRSKLVKKADAVFSEYIRRRFADRNGITECCTCGKKDHWKKLQCGHFQSRRFYSTRWDEQNCAVQCSGCNVFKYGEQYKFSIYIDQKYGPGTSEGLLKKANKIYKLSNYDIQEIIEYYKAELSKF